MGCFDGKISGLFDGIKRPIEDFVFEHVDMPFEMKARYARRLEEGGRIDDAVDQYVLIGDEIFDTNYLFFTRYFYNKGFALAKAGLYRLALEAADLAWTFQVDDADRSDYEDLVGYIFWNIGNELSKKYYNNEIDNYDEVRSMYTISAECYAEVCKTLSTYSTDDKRCNAAIEVAYKAGDYSAAKEAYEHIPFHLIDREDLSNYAELLYHEGLYEKALSIMNGIVASLDEKNGIHNSAWYALFKGWCNLRLGNFMDAYIDFNCAVLPSIGGNVFRQEVKASLAYLVYSQQKQKGMKVSGKGLLEMVSATDAEGLLEISRTDVDGVSPLSVDEIVRMFTHLIVYSSKSGEGESLLKIAKIFTEYMSLGWLDIATDMPALEKARTAEPLIKTIKTVIAHAESQRKWKDVDRSYEAASSLAEAASRIFPDNIEVLRLYARSKRRHAASVDKKSPHWPPSKLFKSALEISTKALEKAGGMKNANRELVLEHGLALTEYGECLVDNNLEGEDLQKQILNKAIKHFEGAIKRFPDDPQILLVYAWTVYNVAKREKISFPEAVKVATFVKEKVMKLAGSTVHDNGEAIRVYLWAVMENAYYEIKASNLQLADKILKDHDLRKLFVEADNLVKGKRWKKDLMYAEGRLYYLEALILDGDRQRLAALQYESCKHLSSFAQPTLDESMLANEKFEYYFKLLDKIAPLEPKKGFISRTRGWIRARQGRYVEAIKFFRQSLGEFVSSEEIHPMFNAREGLMEALKNQTCQMEPPTDIKAENALEILELAWENAEAGGVEDDYVRREVIPDLRVVMGKYRILGGGGTKEQVERLSKLLGAMKGAKSGKLRRFLKDIGV